jgi:hypothetical protein
MKRSLDYKEKFKSFRNKTLYDKLESSQQAYIKKLSIDYHFTFQEFRQVVEACRDLSMWGENDLEIWWQEQVNRRPYSKPGDKKNILLQLQYFLDQLRRQEKRYPDSGLFNPKNANPIPSLPKIMIKRYLVCARWHRIKPSAAIYVRLMPLKIVYMDAAIVRSRHFMERIF